MIIVFFKQKTGYEMRISDWSSDVCSSDLIDLGRTEIARVDLDDAAAALLAIALLVDAATLEAQVDASIGERPLDEGADVRRFARRQRSEERRGGKACVSTCSTRGSPYHYTKTTSIKSTIATK